MRFQVGVVSGAVAGSQDDLVASPISSLPDAWGSTGFSFPANDRYSSLRNDGGRNTYLALGSSIATDVDSEYYFSFLLRTSSTGSPDFSLGLYTGDGSTGLTLGNAGTSVSTTYFVIGKFTTVASGADRFDYSLLTGTDALPSSEPVTWDQTRTSNPGSDYEAFRLRTRTSGNTTDIDEVRFGTSFADVTVVPEPSSLALLGLGSLLLLRRRRVRATVGRRS